MRLRADELFLSGLPDTVSRLTLCVALVLCPLPPSLGIEASVKLPHE